MKSDALKKNLFWILAGVAPLLTFVTFVLIFMFVGGEVASKSETIAKDLKELSDKRAKGVKGLATMDKQKDVIATQKQRLWEANWNQELKLFTWPNQPDLKVFEQRYQKFGEKMQVVNDELNTFSTKSIYEGAFDRMADGVKPTQFAGGNWKYVLRYVSEWGQKTPTQPQVWLALEDLWVQKGLLEPVAAVNASAAVFTAVDDGRNPLKRKFRSRVWDLDLEVPTAGKEAGKIVRATLTNRTDRMQQLGKDKTMNLRVWLADGAPINFRIEGAFLKAREVLDVKPVESLHGIPAGAEVKAISRVEHVLDGRTVPIRRIDAVQLGKVDSRHSVAVLKQPKFIPDDILPDPAAGGGPGGMPGMNRGEGPGGMTSAGGTGGGPGGSGALAVGANFGPPQVVLDANKKRYIDVTEQVRRMPVALVLVVDQMYLQDTLVAFANSSLRFQVTQYHWKRFRGSLANPNDPLAGDGGEFATIAPGYPGGNYPGGSYPGGSYPQSSGSSSGSFPSSTGAGIGPTRNSGTPSASGSSAGSFGMGSFGSGSFGPGSYGGTSGGPTVSEAQSTSGLVELTIYGIITLYEKYDVKGADGATAQPTPTPAPAPAPKPAAPADASGRD